jgi:hypothetical protein
MTAIEKRIEALGRIDDLRMLGKHQEAAALHAVYFPDTPYRESVTPVKVLTGNRPI